MDKKRKRFTNTKLKNDKFFQMDDEELSEQEEEVNEETDGKKQKSGKIHLEKQDPFEGETADEKRLRLAKEYLSEIEGVTGESDAAAMDRDIIAQRLQQDVLESKGKYQRKIADQLSGKTVDENSIRKMRGHQLSVTCVALSSDDKILYTASKDCTIIKWNAETGQKLHSFPGSRRHIKDFEGHIGEVYALSISSDGKYLASGGKDQLVHIWDVQENKLLDSFKGHRDTVTALSFRQGTHQLFSGSNDRTIKIWDCAEMMYIDTLYGHTAEVMSLDSMKKERALSGSRDKSVHIWKVVEETQLIYKSHTASTDCISFLSEDTFVSGGEDGTVALWNSQKKKPVSVVRAAHGVDSSGIPNWISALTTLKNSDIFASGSNDGFIRVWKAEFSKFGITPLLTIPMTGFVNSLAFSNSGKFLVAGIGQEHRLGRWESIKQARNGVRIIPLPTSV